MVYLHLRLVVADAFLLYSRIGIGSAPSFAIVIAIPIEPDEKNCNRLRNSSNNCRCERTLRPLALN